MELFERVGPRFLQDAVQPLPQGDGRIGVIAAGDPAHRVVAWMPTGDIDPVQHSAVLLEGMVAHPDRTVQKL